MIRNKDFAMLYGGRAVFDKRGEYAGVIKSNRAAGLGSAYWWPKGEVKPRVEFLKQLISKL